MSLPLVERRVAGLELGIVARYMRTLLRGEPAPGASGSSGAYSSLAAEVELRGWWAVSPELDRSRFALVSDLGMRTGQFVQLQDFVPHNRVLHSIIKAMGYDPQGFDGARYGGELSELLA